MASEKEIKAASVELAADTVGVNAERVAEFDDAVDTLLTRVGESSALFVDTVHADHGRLVDKGIPAILAAAAETRRLLRAIDAIESSVEQVRAQVTAYEKRAAALQTVYSERHPDLQQRFLSAFSFGASNPSPADSSVPAWNEKPQKLSADALLTEIRTASELESNVPLLPPPTETKGVGSG